MVWCCFKMPYTDLEKKRKYDREYYLNHRQRRLELQKKHYWENREASLVKRRQYREHLRLQVLSFYSNGKLECTCCGEKHIEFLCIDHISGGGTRNARKLRSLHHNPNLYEWLKRNNFPQGFQVLCHNCNAAKAFYGVCPHRKR